MYRTYVEYELPGVDGKYGVNCMTTVYRTYVDYELPGVDGEYRVNGLTTFYRQQSNMNCLGWMAKM